VRSPLIYLSMEAIEMQLSRWLEEGAGVEMKSERSRRCQLRLGRGITGDKSAAVDLHQIISD